MQPAPSRWFERSRIRSLAFSLALSCSIRREVVPAIHGADQQQIAEPLAGFGVPLAVTATAAALGPHVVGDRVAQSVEFFLGHAHPPIRSLTAALSSGQKWLSFSSSRYAGIRNTKSSTAATKQTLNPSGLALNTG